MIDFRYHIVSLISVFLSLAIGIVLGAGPLRDYIAESLTGQVDQLREETVQLRQERDEYQAQLDDATRFIHEARPALIAGVLPSYTVSIVAMPGVPAELVTSVSEVITQADGSVLNIVSVSEDFLDPAKRPFRSGIAGNLTTYMEPQPSEDASAESIIGAALSQGLSGYDPSDPQQPAEDSLAILELLSTSELVTLDSNVLPTHLIIVLTTGDPAETEEQAAGLGLIKGLDAQRTLVSGVEGEGTLLTVVRADSEARTSYSTTDSLSSEAGKLLVPGALAAIVTGEFGSFGFGEGTDQVFPPRVELQEPEPIAPQPDETEEDDAEENAA